MKSLIFAFRNWKELIRDPLSWIFCLGFPLVMLLLLTLVNNSIPKNAGMDLFSVQKLAPGIMIFGYTFIMLFACMLISGDRKEAFLLRIFTSPMKSSDYILGYLLPLVLLAVGQAVITAITSFLIGAVSGTSLHPLYFGAAVVFSLPAIFLFLGCGLLFGTLLSKNAAPGICSIVITFSGMFGGIWMDVASIGGTLEKICRILPFYHAVQSARFACYGTFVDSLQETGIVLLWAAAVISLSILVFHKKMHS